MEQTTLSNLRKAKNLTQKELAQHLCVSSSLIALYETGKRKPKLEKAIEIGQFFEIPVENIIFGR